MYKNIKNAWIYFFIHMMVEIVCFAPLSAKYDISVGQAAVIGLLYDVLAFCPQFLFGMVHERFKKLDMGSIGTVVMLLGLIVLDYGKYGIRSIAGITLIALGNAVIHICGAVSTVSTGDGKLFPCALYVGGGSFGVIIGQTLGTSGMSKWFLLIPLALIEVLILITNKEWLKDEIKYPRYSITDKNVSVAVIVAVAFLVTMTRSYLGYAIPISWKKELWQAFFLFFGMGIGKAAGGWLADKIGALKTALITIIGSIPFLIFGEDIMLVSMIGVLLFSMTMSLTFGMILSVLNDNPGLAFGVTTMALAFGVIPKFFVDFDKIINIIIIVVGSLICAVLMYKTLRKKEEKSDGTDLA